MASATETRRNGRNQDKDLDVNQSLEALDEELGGPHDTDDTDQRRAGDGNGLRQQRQLRRARGEQRAATESSRDAIRHYVRAWNDGLTAFLPPALFRPAEAVRSTFDVIGQAVELQQVFWDEMAGVWRDDLQTVARESRRDRRSDIRYEERDYTAS